TRMAYVNGDWFVAKASQPRLYHVILQLPNSEKGLEQMVGVNAADNIATHADGLRAGFTQSGVSNSNRIIERHTANQGMYWKSFDFGSETGQGSVLTYPLGPQSPDFSGALNQQYFSHDGGEFIFELPNGLHGYMITDAKGCRLDGAPTSLIASPQQPESNVIENGYSCMFCHREGIIHAIDVVRPHWENKGVGITAAVPEGELDGQEYVDELLKLYVDSDKLTAEINEDRANYKSALESTGAIYGEYDPVSLLKFTFDKDLDGARVAAELGVTLEDFQEYLVAFPQLTPLVGGAATATVSREVFENNFSEIVCTIYLGKPLKFHTACGVEECEPECADAECGDNDGCGGSCGECELGEECIAGGCYAICGTCEGACDEGFVCDKETDECLEIVCEPGENYCEDAITVAKCDALGAGSESAVAATDCSAQGEKVCEEGSCVDVVCSSGQPWCNGDIATTCNTLGTGAADGAESKDCAAEANDVELTVACEYDDEGAAVCQCQPDCEGKACGSDACGGTCGACEEGGEVCDEDQT
ncbi:MAG: hypothetical protein VX938_00030, partial [Myxococcota bacterium]|nr:hypothetical protein [Myxococcota bacterium]